MKGPRPYKVNVTIEASDGSTIVRTVVLTAVRESDAKYRAGIVAPKPGQKVLATAVVK